MGATETDRAIIEHVKPLAKLMKSEVALLHVADGWAARTYREEAGQPRSYRRSGLPGAGTKRIPLGRHSDLAYGDPVTEIVRWISERHFDLVAMSTHGHRFLADVFLGTTASRVQHQVQVPVLLLRAR